MSRSKTSSKAARKRASRCPGSGMSAQYQKIGSEFGECSGCHRNNRMDNAGRIGPHFIPERRYRPNLRPAITGGSVDIEGVANADVFGPNRALPLTEKEFIDAWTRAAGIIKERHRRLTFRQKRGGRNKGAHTQQVRHDYQRLTVESKIRVEELWPRAWRDRIPRLVQLASENDRIDLVIADPVLVGYKAPSGGQDNGLQYPSWLPEPENPQLLMVNVTGRRLVNRWRTQRSMLGGHRYDYIRMFADGAMDALALCSVDLAQTHGIHGVLKTDVSLTDRQQSVYLPIEDALALWAEGVNAREHLLECVDRQSQRELKGNDTLRIETRLHLSGVPSVDIRIVDPTVEFVLRWRKQARSKELA